MPVSTESLLPPTWRQEDFSYVYATAIAAAAGVSWDIPRRDVNSCDVRFYARDDEHEDGPQLFAQLKCTVSGLTSIAAEPDVWRFSLKESNYRQLRIAKTHPPRVLIVVKCPADLSDWVDVTAQQLIVRAEAWWVSLNGEPELPSGQQSTTVSIPRGQVFDVSALLANMRSCP
jgi:hypothetical protein